MNKLKEYLDGLNGMNTGSSSNQIGLIQRAQREHMDSLRSEMREITWLAKQPQIIAQKANQLCVRENRCIEIERRSLELERAEIAQLHERQTKMLASKEAALAAREERYRRACQQLVGFPQSVSDILQERLPRGAQVETLTPSAKKERRGRCFVSITIALIFTGLVYHLDSRLPNYMLPFCFASVGIVVSRFLEDRPCLAKRLAVLTLILWLLTIIAGAYAIFLNETHHP